MIVDIITITLVVSGMAFLLLGAVGLLRFPDFFTRMHAAGKCDTLGVLLIALGMALEHLFLYDFSFMAIQGAFKFLLIAGFVFVTSPTATHAIARAAQRSEIPMWTRPKKEDR